ncbi:MAG TPA: hypothetical protein VNM90_21385 [Haliangium sp.]|nr:hypothetical protein [Haliangium sp.]
MPITIEILPEAQRMVDEADERWVAEHGFLADNPLLNEILHASDLLRTNPQIGIVVRRGHSEIRRLVLHSGGTSTTASAPIGNSSRSSPSGSPAVAALLRSSAGTLAHAHLRPPAHQCPPSSA